jgi:hypothetical protein
MRDSDGTSTTGISERFRKRESAYCTIFSHRHKQTDTLI